MARELSPSEEVAYSRYLGFGTPEEVAKIVADNGKLKSENADRRQKVADLEAELAKAKPPEGAVVLAGDEAAEHTAFKALGIKAADVAKLQTDNAALVEAGAARDRRDAFAKVKTVLGWADEAVDTMLDMKTLDGATVEFKPAKAKDKTGKDVDVEEPWITLAGDGQKAQKFSEFAAASPQLKGIRTDGGTAATPGVSAPEMRGSGVGSGSNGGSGVDAMLEANRKAATAPNPLRPAKT